MTVDWSEMGTLIAEQNPWVGSGLSGPLASQFNGDVIAVAKATWIGEPAVARSPKESPPVEKKRLRRVVGRQGNSVASVSSLGGMATEERPQTPMRARAHTMPPRSILRRNNAVRSVTLPGGATPPRRCVSFHSHVTVEYMDDERHLRTEKAELLSAPRLDRSLFMARNMARLSAQHQQRPLPGAQFSQFFPAATTDSLDGAAGMSPPHLAATLEASTLTAASADNSDLRVNIYFVPDREAGQTRMRMIVAVGAHFLPDEICVKANMSGNKVRVMAGGSGTGSSGAALNERFVLPLEVDPYAVEARLDTKGFLTIEAPLLTPARRAQIQQSQQQH